MAQSIISPALAGFDTLNLQYLGKATIKTFDRLVPFSRLENLSSTETAPIVTKIVNKLQTYIQAIESSILAVGVAHKISIDVVALCQLVEVETSEEYERSSVERGKHLSGLLILANDAYEKANQASSVFRQAEQDLFKIAATTKGLTSIVQVPADPAHPKTLQKTLQDIGSDLVANLGLMADFYKQISELTNWCRWVKVEISEAKGSLATGVVPALDGTEEANHLQSINTHWKRFHEDSSAYYNLISTVQDQYPDLLSESRVSWRAAMGKDEVPEKEQEEGRVIVEPSESASSTIKRLAQKTSNVMRGAVKHLAWCGCFGP
ncbi:hypothetical protein BDZ94DRAFT_1250422 [Collybia nuda]|uniref:Uncharacterized protein n=1 Tax=Collybia nuda TaxID=64659 RepID=A0A9P6CHW6_9AGAR|nr:hypothetical protein BDZ94DRAFT_1250422 [Collybia nuda]